MKLDSWDFQEESFWGHFLPYIKDPLITDINYNGTDIWVEHLEKGIYKTEDVLSEEFVRSFSILISNVVSEQFNKFYPVLEAETEDLRISIIHPSVTNTGYTISIRKTPPILRMSEDEMLRNEYCQGEVLNFLKNCIAAKMNMVFCGTPGAGKTELLKFLTQFIPVEEK